jgi:hypothetical protein
MRWKRVGERVVTFSGVWRVQGLMMGVVKKKKTLDEVLDGDHWWCLVDGTFFLF